jgi:RNA polymerase sigma factor (sigma-70 family)
MPRSSYAVFSDESLCQLYRETRQTEIILVLLNRYERVLAALAKPFSRVLGGWGDIKNELFLLLCRRLTKAEPRAFPYWVRTVARNRIYDLLRKSRPEFWSELPELEFSPSEDWNLALDFEPVHQAIQQLKPEQRQYVELAFLKGYKPREIRQILGWPNDKPKKVRQNAMRNLKILLGQYGEEYQRYLCLI